jgi:hypothetical protein
MRSFMILINFFLLSFACSTGWCDCLVFFLDQLSDGGNLGGGVARASNNCNNIQRCKYHKIPPPPLSPTGGILPHVIWVKNIKREIRTGENFKIFAEG